VFIRVHSRLKIIRHCRDSSLRSECQKSIFAIRQSPE
jgi:hypothetical protein